MKVLTTLFTLLVMGALILLNVATTSLLLHVIYTLVFAVVVIASICTAKLKDGVAQSTSD